MPASMPLQLHRHSRCSAPAQPLLTDKPELTPRRLPDGPWASSIQELHVDCIDPDAGPAQLPLLPNAQRLGYFLPARAQLTAPKARMLLQRAPALRMLAVADRPGGVTGAARRAVKEAGVALASRWMEEFEE